MPRVRSAGTVLVSPRAFERDGTLSVSFKCNAENARASCAPARFGWYRYLMEDRTRDDTSPSGPLRFPDRTLRVIV